MCTYYEMGKNDLQTLHAIKHIEHTLYLPLYVQTIRTVLISYLRGNYSIYLRMNKLAHSLCCYSHFDYLQVQVLWLKLHPSLLRSAQSLSPEDLSFLYTLSGLSGKPIPTGFHIFQQRTGLGWAKNKPTLAVRTGLSRKDYRYRHNWHYARPAQT